MSSSEPLSSADARTTRREFMAAAAAAPTLVAAGAQASLAPALSAPLLAHPRIGAEFFLNRQETRDTVFHHFQRMAETGLTVARIFTLWDQVEPAQGEWHFEGYDWIYDAAAKNGILIANTLCSEDPPGWLDQAPFYHAWKDLSNPALRPLSEIYLEKIVTRYRNHPAHGVWLLQNEPGINSHDEPYVLAEYARWLERKYGTVDKLNAVWYTKLRKFSDAKAPHDPREGGWSDYPSNLDWRRFRCDHLVDQLRWLHAQVDKHHPGALTHCNPPGLTNNMVASGRDMWKIKPTVHFLGASMHAAWNFGMYPRSDFGAAYAYCCDITRSVSAPAPWWVTELQAGPTIFTGNRPLNPSSGEITRWLWDGLGNGARAIVYWLWHPRTEGNEAGEWGLAGASGEPTERTRATQAVATVLKKHQEFFAQAKPVAARAAILYHRDAMLLYSVDNWRRPEDQLMLSLMGCHKALHRAHLPVDFIDCTALEAGGASAYEVLYLPYCFALSAASVSAVREFVRRGGTVWADGLVAWKDEQGVTKQLPPGPLAGVFGFTLEDIQAVWEPFALSAQGDTGGELWRCLIPSDANGATMRGGDGRPVAMERRFGQGRAIYYASAVTYSYLKRDEARVRDWIAAPAVEASRALPVRLDEPGGRVSFHALQAPGRSAAFLNNWGPAVRAAVHFPASTRAVADITTSAAVPFHAAGGFTEVVLDLAEGASAVLLAETA